MEWPRASLAMVACAVCVVCSPTGPEDYVEARLTLEEDVVTPGAASSALVEVTNHGKDAVEIEVVTCPPRVLVYDSRGNRIEQPSVSCLLILSAPLVLEPGETHVHEQGWIAPRVAGAYRLKAWVALVGGGLPVMTNRVAVDVRPTAE